MNAKGSNRANCRQSLDLVKSRSLRLALLLLLAAGSASRSEAVEVSQQTKHDLARQIEALRSDRSPAAAAQRETIPVPVYQFKVDRVLRLPVKETSAGTGSGAAPVLRRASAALPYLVAEQYIPESIRHEGEIRPQSIFGADDRQIFDDHSYPFRTVGRVSTGEGSCTGTLVGPRHLLTASHCVVWNGDGTVGWLKFEASSYDDYNLGVAYATRVYRYLKVPGPRIKAYETAFDFVVAILDTRVGDQVGWMGSKAYLPRWNKRPSWYNIGYPGDLGDTTKPVFQKGCDILKSVAQSYNGRASLLLLSLCDISPGQSGGPLYGVWADGPYVVAVTSAATNAANRFGGGALLPALVVQALKKQP